MQGTTTLSYIDTLRKAFYTYLNLNILTIIIIIIIIVIIIWIYYIFNIPCKLKLAYFKKFLKLDTQGYLINVAHFHITVIVLRCQPNANVNIFFLLL